jgi:ribosomal protein S18 acetylase RimI-like enzyme
MIERAGPEAAVRVRAIRLRALADAPDAFGTLLAEDEARPLSEWIRRLEAPEAAVFLAVEAGRDVGIVFGRPYEDRGAVEGAAGLFGMWVAPQTRRDGVGGALVDAVVGWARGAGYARVLLDVADGNVPAIRLYEARGFLPTGVRGTLPPPREHVLEHQRGRELR